MSETRRLTYTGEHPATFLEPGIGILEDGDEFDVPAERLRAFMRRADVEHAGECPAPPCRCGEEPERADNGSDGEDLEDPPGLPGGDEDGLDPAGAAPAGSGERVAVDKRRRSRAAEAGPGADEAASGTAAGEDG